MAQKKRTGGKEEERIRIIREEKKGRERKNKKVKKKQPSTETKNPKPQTKMWDEGSDAEITRATPEDAATIPEVKYEHLDHPADVIIHAWGLSLREAYEQAAMGMFGYMTDIETVDIEEVREVEAEAEDLEGLLFHFLDECLFIFSCEPYFIARKVEITEWVADDGEEVEEGKGEEVEEGKGGETSKDSEGEEGKESKEKEGKEEKVEKSEEKEEKQEKTAEERKEGKGEKEEPMKEEEKDTEEERERKKLNKEEPMEEEEEEGGKEGGGNTDHGGTGGEGTSGTEGHGIGGGDSGNKVYRIRAKLFGEEFQLGKHPQGTEVKAITYGSMQVYNKPGQHEVFVLIDI